VLSNFLIGLREGLEASLVVGILVSYVVRTGNRDRLRSVWAGVAAAVSVSLIFGAVLTFGPKGLTFEAQEIIGGTLSLVAVGFITWMIFWMARSAQFIKRDLESRLDGALTQGGAAVGLIAALAVGREGLETALFIWSGTQAAGETLNPLLGALLGLAVAVLLGIGIYRGAVHIDLRKFFSITGAFLIIVAAGVLSYGIHDLQEAGVLPGLNNLAFDVSSTISPTGWVGTVLKGVFNFSPATTWLEAIAWVAYVAVVMPLFLRAVTGHSRRRSRSDVAKPSSLGGSTNSASDSPNRVASDARGLSASGA
jgi:high-affinity iron transporter